VFDWAWAEAYARRGIEYYPKLLGAIPFTPVSGARVLAADDEARATLVAAALELAKRYSSLHVLFATEAEARLMASRGMLLRRTVQFHWTNAGYADFEAFLAGLARAKRKNIRQERRRVRAAGVTVRALAGAEIAPSQWEFFNRCYRRTYAAHGSTPYLTLEFFARLGATLPEHTVMFLAEREHRPVAASLCVADARRLYGRYWGALEHVPLLHFECCYYRPIEYAIERGIRFVEAGAQGEHKFLRGFVTRPTHSAHWIADPRARAAIARWIEAEREQVKATIAGYNLVSPLKHVRTAGGEVDESG
jgi:hypothetical protein